MNQVTISIVNYCQKHLLARCLDSIERQNLPKNWQTIVVDNNSSDGSADMLKHNYSFIKVINLDKNLGFAGGHNIAFAQTNSPVFIVLNPDIIITQNSLENLVKTLNNFPAAGIVGPCLLNPDGSPQYSARRFYNWYTIACRRLPVPGRKKANNYHLMKDQQLNNTISVDWVLGAAMAIRRKAFAQKELFDTRYHLYFEDVDLCYFAKKRGWHILYCPQSKMIHDHQRTSAKGIISSALIKHLISWCKFCIKCKNYPLEPNSSPLINPSTHSGL